MLELLNDLLSKTKSKTIKWVYDSVRKAYKLSEPYGISKIDGSVFTVNMDVYLHFTTEQMVELVPLNQEHVNENQKKTYKIGSSQSSKMGSEIMEIYDTIQLLNIEFEIFSNLKPIDNV